MPHQIVEAHNVDVKMYVSLRQHTMFMGPSFCRGESAFNEGHRCFLLQNVVRIPGIADTAPLMHATLSPAGLGLDSTSDDGVRQGDGMSSLAFCVLIDPIVQEEHELGQRTGDYVVFDVDGGCISGPIPNIMRIVTTDFWMGISGDTSRRITPMHRQTRPFTTANVFGLCGSGLRNTRCHGKHFHATPPATKVHEGRVPTQPHRCQPSGLDIWPPKSAALPPRPPSS
jgi:hypothetical protein